jgi:hypothetical protein
MREDEFREVVRRLISEGRHPDNNSIRQEMRSSKWGTRSGLSSDETRWRIDEMDRAGYDWNSSKRAKKLVPKRV